MEPASPRQVSGAAALVKQKHPAFSAAQVKSALVNTATQDVTTDDFGTAVDAQWLGAGKLDANAAVTDNVTVTPASLSFGALKSGSLPSTIQLTVTNTGSSAVTLSVAVAPGTARDGHRDAGRRQTDAFAGGGGVGLGTGGAVGLRSQRGRLLGRGDAARFGRVAARSLSLPDWQRARGQPDSAYGRSVRRNRGSGYPGWDPVLQAAGSVWRSGGKCSRDVDGSGRGIARQRR